ncbi:MAG: hypothetical protein LUD82_06225, partial [Clostridiales bacterium]|nr:hypothetical protein [Clostridiales bacterium]
EIDLLNCETVIVQRFPKKTGAARNLCSACLSIIAVQSTSFPAFIRFPPKGSLFLPVSDRIALFLAECGNGTRSSQSPAEKRRALRAGSGFHAKGV